MRIGPVPKVSAPGPKAEVNNRPTQERILAAAEVLFAEAGYEGTSIRQIALQAGVPVALAYLDYARREVGLDSAWRVSGDVHADLACFAQRLQGRAGKRPALAAPVRLR